MSESQEAERVGLGVEVSALRLYLVQAKDECSRLRKQAALALEHLTACKASKMTPSQMASVDLAREVLTRITSEENAP